MADSESIAWRSSVEARILELETLVDGWQELGDYRDDSGHRVPPWVSTLGWHIERLRQAFDGSQQ